MSRWWQWWSAKSPTTSTPPTHATHPNDHPHSDRDLFQASERDEAMEIDNPLVVKDGSSLSAVRSPRFNGVGHPTKALRGLSANNDIMQVDSVVKPNGITLTAHGSVKTSTSSEKEEGEISEEDEHAARASTERSSKRPRQATSTNSSRHSSRLHEPPTKSASSLLPQNRSIPIVTAPPLAPRNPSLQRMPIPRGPNHSRSPAGEAGPSGSIPSASASMSPAEAHQYMDIIRNLLREGITPEALIRRGATERYVTAVCEDIVRGTRRRKALWLEAREPDRGASEAPSTLGSASPRSPRRSPSPRVRIAVAMKRSESHSSESSAEIKVMPSPPSGPRRLVPSSSWTPPKPSAVAPSPVLPQPMVVESFKPDAAFAAKLRSPVGQLEIPSNSSRSSTDGSAPKISSLDVASDLYATTAAKQYLDSIDLYPTPTDRTPYPLPLKPEARPLEMSFAPALPASLLETKRKALESLKLSAQASDSPSQVGNSVEDALLSVRQRAIESMRRRRINGSATPVASGKTTPIPIIIPLTPDGASQTASTSSTAVPVFFGEKSLAEQTDDLEREIMALDPANVARLTPLPSPEEGEIDDDPMVIDPISTFTTSASSSAPTIVSRNTRRPNAEDLANRPTSLPSTSSRRMFGVPQKAHRLVLEIDDSDSDDESLFDVPIEEDIKRRLLEEKEENIRRLKEEIATRLRRKIKGKSKANRDADRSKEVTPEVMAMAEAAVAGMTNEAIQEAAYELRQGEREEVMDIDTETSIKVVISEDIPRAADNSSADAELTLMAAHEATSFKPYQSLLARYPSLNKKNRAFQASGPTGEASIDETLLSSIILTRVLANNATATICNAETAGGACADGTCSAVHLSRLRSTQDDLVEYAVRISGAKVEKAQAAVMAVLNQRGSTPDSRAGLDHQDASAILGLVQALLRT